MSLNQGVLAERIRERLQALGYWKHDRPDVRRFCEEFGYTTQYVYGWLHGRIPSFAYITRLAADLGVTVELLAFGSRAGPDEGSARPGARRRSRPPEGRESARQEAPARPPGAELVRRGSGRGQVIEHPLARIGLLMERLSKSEAELQSTVRAWRDSQERFRKIFEDGPLGMVVFDRATLALLGVNHRFAEMLGRAPADMVGCHVLSFNHPEDAAPGAAAIAQVLSGAAPFATRQSRYVHVSGEVLWGHVTTICVQNDTAVACGVEMVQDVTERRAAEERLESLFDRVPVGLYRATPDGRLLDGNPALVQILGHQDRESLLATDPAELWVDADAHWRWRQTLERDGIARDFEKELRRADGTIIWVRDSARAVYDGTGSVAAWEGAVEDITARKRAEDTTRALAQIDRELTGTRDYRRVAQAVLQAVETLLPDSAGHLWELLPEGDGLRLIGTRGLRAEPESPSTRRRLGEGLVGKVVLTRTPIASADARADGRVKYADWLAVEGVVSVIALPLLHAETIYGALSLFTRTRHEFAPDEVKLLESFAAQAAAAIAIARLYKDAQRERREAAVLADLAGTISASLDLDTVLQQIVEGARELCGSDLARIAVRRPPTNEMVFAHSSGAWCGPEEPRRVEPGRGLGGRVLETGQPYRTDRYRDDSKPGRETRTIGTTAEMGVPIRVGSGIEGLIVVRNGSDRPFSDRDEKILLRLADHAAVAICHAQLVEEAERCRRAAECPAALSRAGAGAAAPAVVG